MATATQVLIAGSSAGGNVQFSFFVVASNESNSGLAVILGIDHMAKLIRSRAQHALIGGIVNAGYFPDYDSKVPIRWVAKRTDRYGFNVNEINNGYAMYASNMRNMSRMMNSLGGSNMKCILSRAAIARSDDCIFAEYIIPHVRTPLMLFQVNTRHLSIA